jgi:hypothetical protein
MIKKVVQRATGKFNGLVGESVAEVEVQTRDEFVDAHKDHKDKDFDFSKALSMGEILSNGGSKDLIFDNPYTGEQVKVNVDDLQISDLSNSFISCRISFYPHK